MHVKKRKSNELWNKRKERFQKAFIIIQQSHTNNVQSFHRNESQSSVSSSSFFLFEEEKAKKKKNKTKPKRQQSFEEDKERK